MPERVRAEAIGHRDDREIGEFFAAELVADLHARRLVAHRVGDDIVERLLLFDDAQDRAQLAQVLKLGLIEQVLRAGRGDRRLFARTRRRAAPRRRRRANRRRRRLSCAACAISFSVMSRSGRFAKRALSAFEKRVRSSGSTSAPSSKRLCAATPSEVTTIATPVCGESQMS